MLEIIELDSNFFLLWEVVIFFLDENIVSTYNSGISQVWATNIYIERALKKSFRHFKMLLV